MGFPELDVRHVTKDEYDAFIEKHKKHIRRANRPPESDGYVVYLDTRRRGALIAMEATDGHAYTIVANTDDMVEFERLTRQCLEENLDLFSRKQAELRGKDYDAWAVPFIERYYEERRKK